MIFLSDTERNLVGFKYYNYNCFAISPLGERRLAKLGYRERQKSHDLRSTKERRLSDTADYWYDILRGIAHKTSYGYWNWSKTRRKYE